MVVGQDDQRRELGQFDVIDADGNVLRQSLSELRNLGYLVRILGPCVVHISHPMGYIATALCPGKSQQRDGTTPPQPSGLSAVPASHASSPPQSASNGMRVNIVPNSEYAARPWR